MYKIDPSKPWRIIFPDGRVLAITQVEPEFKDDADEKAAMEIVRALEFMRMTKEANP